VTQSVDGLLAHELKASRAYHLAAKVRLGGDGAGPVTYDIWVRDRPGRRLPALTGRNPDP